MKTTKDWVPVVLITAGCGVIGWIWGLMTAAAKTDALSTALTSIVALVTAGIAFLGYRRVQDTVLENRARLAQLQNLKAANTDQAALATAAMENLGDATERLSVAGTIFGLVLIVAGIAFLGGYYHSREEPHEAPWLHSVKPKSVAAGYSWLLVYEKLRAMGYDETVAADLYALQRDENPAKQDSLASAIRNLVSGTKPEQK